MSKRFRLLVVLALIAVSIFFLYPTVQWYFFVPEEMKSLAASSREQVREYSRDEARGALAVLSALALEDESALLPDEYGFVIDAAETNYRLEDREIPAEWTVSKIFFPAFKSDASANNSTVLKSTKPLAVFLYSSIARFASAYSVSYSTNWSSASKT